MLGMVGVLTAAICTSCVDEQNPTGLRLGVPQPTVELKLSDGCARFQVRFDAGGAPIIEPIYNTGSCGLNELRLLSDTAGSFDPATGTLRVAVVMENIGTTAVIPDVRLFFNADSVKRFDAQGEPVPGTPDILAYQPDSVESGGRRARWFWDAWLAPAGQPQVLQPGGRTERRWVEFRGTGWTERVRLKLFAWGAKQSIVPPTPPDSTPAFASDPAYIVKLPTSKITWVRDLLVVQFAATATQRQKDSIVASISGVVVGGKPSSMEGGGFYLVRLPADPTHARLAAAESALQSSSLVRRAVRYFSMDLRPTYRFANDGPGWRRTTWRADTVASLLPAIRTGHWGLRYSRFPLAWGCSVGDQTLHVGVLDVGFRVASLMMLDLSYNVSSARNADLPGDTALAHGSWVASILAARGNNGISITGAVWHAALDLVDPTPLDSLGGPRYSAGVREQPYLELLAATDSLIRRGVRVVNISLGAGDSGIVDLSDTNAVNYARTVTSSIAFSANQLGNDPLLVVSSGNVPQADPRVSVFPYLHDDAPQRTVVVGAFSRDGMLRTAPQGSPHIDVVAPGDSIEALDPGGQPVYVSGASAATPLVSGLASLLFAFDPRLTAAEVRSLILQGALRAGRTVGGYPVLDAYESLRIAAERPGAPLCGNRVWTANDKIVVQRSVANANPVDEVLADSLPFISHVNVFHGGRRVQNDIPSDTTGALIWNPNGTWTATSNLPLGPESGGTFWSMGGTDHDLTMFLDTKISADVVTSSLFQLPNFNQTGSIVIGTYDEGADLSTALCIRMHGTTCETYTYTNRYVDPVDAIAPEADRGFVAVNHWAQTPTVTSWSACTDDPTEQCANVDLAVARVGPTQIFELDLVNRTRTARWAVNAYVRWLAVSERNDELVAAEESGATCSLVYRDVKRPSVAGSALRTIPQALNYCSFPGTATIAPRVSTPFGRR